MARVMVEGRSCRVVAFLRQFCSDLGGRGTGFLSRLKVKKVAGWNFAAMHRRWHGERRHHLCNGVGGVAAPAWLIAPDWRDLNRRREIEEGMKFAKMHKKLKTTKFVIGDLSDTSDGGTFYRRSQQAMPHKNSDRATGATWVRVISFYLKG